MFMSRDTVRIAICCEDEQSQRPENLECGKHTRMLEQEISHRVLRSIMLAASS